MERDMEAEREYEIDREVSEGRGEMEEGTG